MSHIYIYTYRYRYVCLYVHIYMHKTRDSLRINMEAANVHTSHTTETWKHEVSCFLFKKVTNKKLTEIPSSINQKNIIPLQNLEAGPVFWCHFFHKPWLFSREPRSIFKTFLGSNSSAPQGLHRHHSDRCETDGMGRYFTNYQQINDLKREG